MKDLRTIAATVVMLVVFAGVTGCASTRSNIEYIPAGESPSRIGVPVKGVVIHSDDARPNAKVYPKQIILQTSYSGDKTFDINDRAIDAVFDDAVTSELSRLGVSVSIAKDIDGPLDKTTKDRIRKAVMAQYPGVKVAFGLKIKDFFATTERKLVTTNVEVNSSIEFYALDVETGELFWSEYASEWEDTVVSADREYLIGQLDDVLSNLMKKAVKENLTLRDALVRIGSRR